MVSGVYPTAQPSLGLLLLKSVSNALSHAIENRAEKTVRVRTWFQSLIRNVLILASFVLWTIAAFSFTFIAGMVVAGISCSLLSWLMKGNPAPLQAPPVVNTRR